MIRTSISLNDFANRISKIRFSLFFLLVLVVDVMVVWGKFLCICKLKLFGLFFCEILSLKWLEKFSNSIISVWSSVLSRVNVKFVISVVFCECVFMNFSVLYNVDIYNLFLFYMCVSVCVVLFCAFAAYRSFR